MGFAVEDEGGGGGGLAEFDERWKGLADGIRRHELAAERTAIYTALVASWAQREQHTFGYDRPFAVVALGGIAAAGVPSSSGYTTFLVGLVDGWSTMLSSSAPADLTPEFRVLPYALSWGGVMIGSEILRRGRHSIL